LAAPAADMLVADDATNTSRAATPPRTVAKRLIKSTDAIREG